MKHFVKNETLSKNYCVHLYSEVSEKDLSEKVNRTFMSLGYKLKKGTPVAGEYVKGNRALRLALGAFHKYFKFSTNFSNKENDIRVTISKKSSGMSGGIIGLNQVKKELKKIAAHLEKI